MEGDRDYYARQQKRADESLPYIIAMFAIALFAFVVKCVCNWICN